MTQQPFSIRAKMRSVFVVSFALFLLINATLSFTTPIKFDPYKYSYRGWSWWTMEALRRDKRECNVALLGSSLIVSAVAGCDANHLNQKLDMTQHHDVAYLDEQLTNTFGGQFHTFNLSAPGLMPSDAYLMLKAMIATANRPDIVIYGVAPRDFIDSQLNGPNDTEPFHYLTRIVNIDEIGNAVFRSLWSKLDWYFQRAIYMYNYSLDFRLAWTEACERILSKVVPRPYSDHPFSYWDRVAMMPTYMPGEMQPGAIISSPLKASDIVFKDNTVEYRNRYKKPDAHTFRSQMYFLRKLAEYCHRERVELVLVNMPIMHANAAILPAGVHNWYVNSLREFAWNHNVIYYDLCDFNKYARADYNDTVHLNGFGAKKFFDSLLTELKNDPRASTELRISGFKLAETGKARQHKRVY